MPNLFEGIFKLLTLDPREERKKHELSYANRNEKLKVFDWHKAAHLIREKQPHEARAGLAGDWVFSNVLIYQEGEIPEDAVDEKGFGYFYLCSNWAVPTLELDGEQQECWVSGDERPEWEDGHTFWPQSARDILHGQTDNNV